MAEKMAELPNEIFRKWQHSFEEDNSGINVYRPTDYNFPRARGRAGLEFSPDGTFTEYAIGPADRQQRETGRWSALTPGKVQVSFDKAGRAPRILEIVQSDQNVLKIRAVAA